MLAALCLSFVPILTGSSWVPEHVDQLVKAHFKRQVEERRPDIRVRFDDSSCSEQVQYHYGGDSFKTTSKSLLWTAHFEVGLTEMIDGRKIDFPFWVGAVPEISTAASSANVSKSETVRTSKWLPWVIGAVGIGLLGVAITRSQSEAAAPVPAPETALRLRRF